MLKDQLMQFENAVAVGGVRAGLQFLNRRVPHRCTAVYRVDGDQLSLVELVDKLNDPSSATLPPIPLAQSFCQAAISGGSVNTANSELESRLDDKTYQGVMSSYVGLPIAKSAGTLFGTLCHYDFDQKNIDDEEFEFLQSAAAVLAKAL